MKRQKRKLWLALLVAAFLLVGCEKQPVISEIPQTCTEAPSPVESETEIVESEEGGEESSQSEEGSVPEDSSETVESLETGETLETQPEEDAEPEVDLIMVGDILMHMRVTNSGKQPDGSYNFDRMFAPTKEMVESADLAIVNQEVILGGPELGFSGYPQFNAPYEVADGIVNAGFDVVLHATNHTVDKGKEGALNCLNYWETNFPEIGIVGMYDSQEDRDEIYVYEQEGIRIAILNYTYGTNGLPVPEDMPYLVNLMSESLIKADVAKAREVSDFVIVAPHWGTEYVHEPNKWQRKWGEFMIDCGADLVLGTHPHVIQPVEWVETPAGNSGLVYWSIGNFINSTGSSGAGVAERMLGAMATVTIAKTEEGEVYIKEYGAQPLITYVSADSKEIITYPMAEFTEEMAANSSTQQKDPNFTLAYCKQVWEMVFGNLGIKE